MPEEDQDCFEISTRPEQVRVSEVNAKDGKGACWARSYVQKLWKGEEYTLQIDSHMRFVEGWDDLMIESHSTCLSKKAILTTYPPGYTPPNELGLKTVRKIYPSSFEEDGVIRFKSKKFSQEEIDGGPLLGAICAAGFLFGPSQIIADVPYDPHLYFFEEEINLSVRLWTHGWDFYYPNDVFIYHDWNRKRRRTHFDDHANAGELNKRARRRITHFLGVKEAEDLSVLIDIDKYALGNSRTLEEFERFSGIDFKRQVIVKKDYLLDELYDLDELFEFG